MQTKLRLLKVSKQTRVNRKNYQNKTIVSDPKINLAGNWLRKAGFLTGEVVEVLVADQFIQIVKKGARA